MTVLLRTKRSPAAKTGHRRREQRPASSHARPAPSPANRERTPPAPEDRALYTCGCGFVFSHDVTTSVACPHCGDTQAW